jgi:uncharacterized lipoprotein YajG
MNYVVKTHIVLLLAGIVIAGCTSTPTTQKGTWNPSDSQRSHSKQAQDELDTSVSKDK